MIQTQDSGLLSLVEDAGLNASAPLQQRWLDGWIVRFAPGKAKRARCINAVAPGRLPFADKLALCEPVFKEAQLPLLVRLTPFSAPGTLDRDLERLGWQAIDDTRVMVHPSIASMAPAIEAPAKGLRLESVGLERYAQVIGAWRGSPTAQRQAHALRLVQSPVPFFAFVLKRSGRTVAGGQFAVEGRLVGLYDVFTAPEARGQGHAGVLCQAMLAHAAARGAGQAYLQVDGSNLGARSVYRRLGFEERYRYHYRSPEPDAA